MAWLIWSWPTCCNDHHTHLVACRVLPIVIIFFAWLLDWPLVHLLILTTVNNRFLTTMCSCGWSLIRGVQVVGVVADSWPCLLMLKIKYFLYRLVRTEAISIWWIWCQIFSNKSVSHLNHRFILISSLVIIHYWIT